MNDEEKRWYSGIENQIHGQAITDRDELHSFNDQTAERDKIMVGLSWGALVLASVFAWLKIWWLAVAMGLLFLWIPLAAILDLLTRHQRMIWLNLRGIRRDLMWLQPDTTIRQDWTSDE